MELNPIRQLSQLPAVDQILRSKALAELALRFPQRHLTKWTRTSIENHRQQILRGEEHTPENLLESIVSGVMQLAQQDTRGSLQRVINATGIMLHTNLGRSPLAERAIHRIRELAAYTNLEMDLTSGNRNRRGERVTRMIAELTGAEDCLVVNNCAAATILALQAIAAGSEVIVSRGQLVEIGGGFRLPDVFRSAGVTLCEVGTTNRTYLRDYQTHCSDATGAILRVHRSNFAQVGFVSEPGIEQLVTLKKPSSVPVIDDLGSGCVIDLSSFGIHEPMVQDSVSAGADLCLFSGDKLFGGPQSGILVGKSGWIERLRSHPLMRALRPDKTTLAALEATTEIHLSKQALEELPLYQMLSRSETSVRQACERLATGIPSSAVKAEVVPSVSQFGGGSVPGVEISSFALSLRTEANESLVTAMRCGTPAILARQANDQVLLDLRTVLPHEMESLQTRLSDCIREHG